MTLARRNAFGWHNAATAATPSANQVTLCPFFVNTRFTSAAITGSSSTMATATSEPITAIVSSGSDCGVELMFLRMVIRPMLVWSARPLATVPRTLLRRPTPAPGGAPLRAPDYDRVRAARGRTRRFGHAPRRASQRRPSGRGRHPRRQWHRQLQALYSSVQCGLAPSYGTPRRALPARWLPRAPPTPGVGRGRQHP